MPKKGGAEESSKKAQGQARKAAAAAAKKEEGNKKKQAVEDEKWKEGSKSSAKKEAEESKKREAAAKKAERAALLAAEEATLKAAKGTSSKKAEKRTKGPSIDSALGSLDRSDGGGAGALTLNASGIDNALDALSLTSQQTITVDRHPERRYKAAFAAFEEKRLPELKEEHPGLRLNQMKELLKKEFEKSPDNPFNQGGNIHYDATKEEIQQKRLEEQEKIEKRLAGSK